ncbi:heparinase II/III domain-containing protein [Actomonas aquatica]|uniref:Heparinase II/III family protein n=1 Tax=Actomonas aquatica TaxID=2866162 RepID=A0ABZ1CG96_9BACT|nr:heparinase II/III family protein [Opitutus sp. WL0086]WRQ89589.1 heparinase II/III family protein [Opitutus sp. WL0086]
MSTSRRSFLRRTALAAAVPLLAGRTATGHPHPESGATPEPNPQAGLLFDRADLPRIRANLELPRFAALRQHLQEVDHTAELHFLREELRLTNRVTDMRRARVLLEESAFAYAVWEKPADLELARTALARLMDYPTWDYFTEAGQYIIGIQRASEATIAVCYALDWIGEHLTAAEITAAEDNVATKGAPACYRTLYGMKFPDRVQGWGFSELDDYPYRFDLSRWPLILNATNLKIIPTCALGIAAVWFHGRHPQAASWLEMSRQSATAFSVMYGLDGSYDEGIGYWGYTTLHLAMQAEVLYRRLGIDDRHLINYPGTTRYALHMSMPTRGAIATNPHETATYTATPKGAINPALDVINFGDSGTGGVDVSVAPWVGRITGDPLCNHIANTIGGMKHLPAAIWYDADAPTAAPSADLLDVRLSNDWVISRTGWTADDTVVALRSGGPANHEHADRNSLIFKAHGERLFHDPFKASYTPTHPQWLLRLTEAHTAILIDGQGHQYHDGSEGTNASWASATVTAYSTGEAWMCVTSEAAPAYQLINDKVSRVERSLLFLKPDVLIVLDRVVLDAQHPAPVQARFQVYNEDGAGRADAGDRLFTIQRPFASLIASIHSAGNFIVRTAQHDLPATAGVFPYVEIESAAASTHTLLTVASASAPDGPKPRVRVSAAGEGWTVTATQGARTMQAHIDPTGDHPTFTVV